ncbi:50S ribosomal protein L32 [candidate division WWE3 bacterium]|uniref:Large ribosomal subunit protein bL32 n=1 Tax=candidate division WWE3 bacterium TaxID=2053526 RepID=A0A955LL32_UNCKA|nr:50S ribosomal protein L32 [candidate division WWE3 bacterium]
MGAVPKKQPSDTRKNQRHRAWENSQIQAMHVDLITCSNCGEQTVKHRACLSCGFYKGVAVTEPKAQVRKVSE